MKTQTLTTRDAVAYMRLTVLALALLAPRSSEACDRRRVPPAVIVAAADVVVLGEVIEVSGREVMVRPIRVLKGDASGPMRITDVHTARNGLCPEVVAAKGGRYVFAVTSDGNAFRTVDPDDGVSAESTVERAATDAALKGAHSAAKEHGSTGLRYTLVAPRGRYRASEDIDLYIVLDNTGKVPVQMTSRTWPPEQHTFCALQFSPAVAAVPVPIPKQDIADYFSQHGIQTFDLPIAPDMRWLIQLQRVNTAARGWGYKEGLGFQYYPLTPGSYRVRATCRGYFTGAPIETNEIALTIER
jgi:hypothetical protein